MSPSRSREDDNDNKDDNDDDITFVLKSEQTCIDFIGLSGT